MTPPPETRYAKNGDVHIAFQTLGNGPLDLVVVPEWVTHVEAAWEHPVTARFLRRLATFGRLIMFDKRGVGLSDPVSVNEVPSLETWRDDLGAVLDAVGSERAVLLGHGHGGQMALLFAATLPDRVESLVLFNAYARLAFAPDYECGIPSETQDRITKSIEESWGRTDSPILDVIAPSVSNVDGVRDWWARLERLACSPGVAGAMQRAILKFDVRHILQAVTVPALVIQSANARFVRVGHGRYLAAHLQKAQYLEVDSRDHWPWVGNASEQVVTAIEGFAMSPGAVTPTDRVLATVLFTDVVDSTGRVAELGDRTWREVLEDLDALVDRQVTRYGGRVVGAAGDGHLAVFDGPGRGISCAAAIREAVRSLGLEVRTGLHCGEIELRGRAISGIAVHIAARIMALAEGGEVLISGSIPPLVAGSSFEFDDRGAHKLRGVPGDWRVFSLESS